MELLETIYELTSGGSHRPVLVSPLGEYMQARWVKAAEHHAPNVAELHARDAAAISESQRTGHAAPQHAGFAAGVFAQRKMAPVELPESIPGVHIALDCDARRVRIFDPLERLPNRAGIEAAFLAVYHKHRVPRPEVVYERLLDDELSGWKTWLEKAEREGLIERVTEAVAEGEPEVESAEHYGKQQPESESEKEVEASEAVDYATIDGTAAGQPAEETPASEQETPTEQPKPAPAKHRPSGRRR